MNAEKNTQNTVALNRLFWRWAVVFIILGVFFVWAAWRMKSAAQMPHAPAVAAAADSHAEPHVEYWTCSMHPDVRSPEPGQCPVCSMQLIPKYVGSDTPGMKPDIAPPESPHVHASPPAPQQKMWYRCTMPECGDVGSDDPDSRCPVCGMKREPVGLVGDDDGGEYELKLSERARRLAEIASEPLENRLLYKRIRTVGKIGYDETRHKMVSAWVGGRIDKIFADFTGMVVREGDHLVEIYSPELISAQEEYLQSRRAAASMQADGAERLLASARRKLELLGIDDVQIADIEASGQPQTRLVIHAPIGGVIVAKRVMEGMYAKTGDRLYEIADLTSVWLLLNVYESDLPWIRPFQDVSVTAEALPGEQFVGRIAFVDPVVDAATRTIVVRVNVANPDRKLKPEMFVTAEIDAVIGADCRPAAPQIDAAYACPMHPWETSSDPADCPVCGMPMTAVADADGSNAEPGPVLSIPRSAVMQTGRRALAYLEIEPGAYRAAEILLGPLAHDEDGREFYPVLNGLSEGQRVVTRGGFAIDSQMQLAGRPSLFQAAAPPLHHQIPAEMKHDRTEMNQDQTSTSEHEPHMQQEHAMQPMLSPQEESQTVCPVMGNEIVEDVYTDYLGVRIYFCCPPCIAKFNADPEKYIPKLPELIQAKIRAAQAPQTICPVMGNEIVEDVFTDYLGVRVYFCCPPCIAKFNADPDKYIPNLPQHVQMRIKTAREAQADD